MRLSQNDEGVLNQPHLSLPILFSHLEHVGVFMIERRRANFVSDEANFAVGCGQSGEKFNVV